MRQELPGPPNVDAWVKRGNVFKTAMSLLGEAPSEPMPMYAELIRGCSEAYGPGCWGTIYTADVRVRREHMERIRRRLACEAPARFDPARPWGA
eukprot:1792413-Alexandrium_andersonii.AAC.1